MTKQNIYDQSRADLQAWVEAKGLKPYTVQQLVKWLYGQRVESFEAMTNLSKQARAWLEEAFELNALEPAFCHVSSDGSVKFGLRLADGEVIESVLMPQANRITLCVSSQVGCAMGCRFCKTAEMKLRRNLTQGEILGQILYAIRFCEEEREESRRLQEIADHQGVSNLVFMGMGEPLHNYEAVAESIRLLIDDQAFGFSRRKITVSTSGLVPEIRRFAKELPVKLAVSLNATSDADRLPLMPINRRYPLAELMAACRDYAQTSDRVVTFEYVMMRDINDSKDHVKELVRLIAQTPCKLNLIPFNEYPGSPYRRPEKERVLYFQRYLADRGFQVNIRYSKGLDVLAACGQLATQV